MAAAFGATAQSIDRVRFDIAPVVMVWDESGAMRSAERVSIGLSETGKMSPIALTGTLQPIPLTAATPYSVSSLRFRVASNAPFEVRVTQAEGPASKIKGFELTLLASGSSAQDPGLVRESPASEGAEIVYSSVRRTAARPGAPSSQGIDLLAIWSGTPPPRVEVVAIPPLDR